jgi:hypothetical protein
MGSSDGPMWDMHSCKDILYFVFLVQLAKLLQCCLQPYFGRFSLQNVVN